MRNLRLDFKLRLGEILLKNGFFLDSKEMFASKDYPFGNYHLFFEESHTNDKSFSVRINVSITNFPVQKIHAIVNELIATKPILSLPLFRLAKIKNKPKCEFERSVFNGKMGCFISVNTIDFYFENLKFCLNNLVYPFFMGFNSQEDFNSWINVPIINNKYDFRIEPIWKDAVNSLIISKLCCSDNFQELFDIWLSKNLPKNETMDTKKDLIDIYKVLRE